MNFIAASGDMAQPADQPSPGSTLRTRIFSALLLAPLALAAIYGGQPYFDILIAVAAVLMASEWRRLSGGALFDVVCLLMSAAVLIAVLLTGMGMALAGFGAIAVMATLVGLTAIFFKEGRSVAVSCAAGVFAVGGFAMSMVWLRALDPVGLNLVIWLFVTIWLTDIFAYFTGRSIGGVRLAPRISPNKTWAGLAGGVFAAALWGALWTTLSGAGVVLAAVLAGMGTAVLAQVGDLGVSVLKRYFGAQDSGSHIPGHGGVLDRMDGFIGAAPFVALAIAIGGPGEILWL